jgi:hypothetical protein
VNTRERLELIRQDCKSDVARPLIAHLAMIAALATSMLEQERRLDAIEATLDRAEAAANRAAASR